MNYHLEDERELLQETKTKTYSWPRNTTALNNKNKSSTFIYMEREGRRESKREMEMEGERRGQEQAPCYHGAGWVMIPHGMFATGRRWFSNRVKIQGLMSLNIQESMPFFLFKVN